MLALSVLALSVLVLSVLVLVLVLGVAVKLGFVSLLYFFSGVAGCSGKKLTNLMKISQ